MYFQYCRLRSGACSLPALEEHTYYFGSRRTTIIYYHRHWAQMNNSQTLHIQRHHGTTAQIGGRLGEIAAPSILDGSTDGRYIQCDRPAALYHWQLYPGTGRWQKFDSRSVHPIGPRIPIRFQATLPRTTRRVSPPPPPSTSLE